MRFRRRIVLLFREFEGLRLGLVRVLGLSLVFACSLFVLAMLLSLLRGLRGGCSIPGRVCVLRGRCLVCVLL